MYQTIDIAMRVKFVIDKLPKIKMESLVFSMVNLFYTNDSSQKLKTHVCNVTFATVSSPISIKQNLNKIRSIFNIPQLNNPASSNIDSCFMVSSLIFSSNRIPDHNDD